MNSMIAGSISTGTCSHNNTFKWSKTHCCIYTFAVYNSADGRSVSKVAYDNFGVVFVKAKESTALLDTKLWDVPWKPYLLTLYFL